MGKSLIPLFHQQAYISGKEFEWEAVGAFREGFQYLKASLLCQPLQFWVGEEIVVAIEGLTPLSPGDSYLPWLEPEPGLPPIPHGDKGFTAWL